MCFQTTLSKDGGYNTIAPYYCYTVTCTKSYKLYIAVGIQKQQCEYEGQLLYFNETQWNKGFLNCSEPVSTCRLKEERYPDLIVDDEPATGVSTHATPTQSNKVVHTNTIAISNTIDRSHQIVESPSDVNPNQNNGGKDNNKAKIIGGVVGAFVGVIVICVALFVTINSIKNRQTANDSDNNMMYI